MLIRRTTRFNLLLPFLTILAATSERFAKLVAEKKTEECWLAKLTDHLVAETKTDDDRLAN